MRPLPHSSAGSVPSAVDRRSFLVAFSLAILAGCTEGNDRAQSRDAPAAAASPVDSLRALARAIAGEIDEPDMAFIETAIRSSLEERMRKIVLSGLAALDVVSQDVHGLPFHALGHPLQVLVAADLDAATFRNDPADEETRHARLFFEVFKSLVIVARFTSHSGRGVLVADDPVPGSFDGDVQVGPDTLVDVVERGGIYLLPAPRWAVS